MNARLQIENFANIRHADIDLRDINVFIGPQASGKSLILKLMYYFNKVALKFCYPHSIDDKKTDLDTVIKYDFSEYFTLSALGSDGFRVQYIDDNGWISVKRQKDQENITIEHSDSFDVLWNQNVRTSPRDMGVQYVDSLSHFEHIYIPANRSFLSLIQRNVFTLWTTPITIDPFIRKFGVILEQMKYFSENLYGKLNINPHVLNGNWKPINGDDYIVHSDGRTVPLYVASSAQQEVFPILFVLSLLEVPKFKNRDNFVEEPEAHLFPMSQKEIVDQIARIYNKREHEVGFSITTHSPYILTAFNNLLLAGQVDLSKLGDEKKRKKYESKALSQDSFGCFIVENGTVKSAMDKETGLIDAGLIDRVSETIEEEFAELLELYDES